MSKIKNIVAREILDSRGNPTLETEVELESGIKGISSVPSGVSTGSFEAWELRDNDPSRYNGKGVLKAVVNVNGEIKEKLVGMEAENQEEIDEIMRDLDGTENKSRLGANAILSVSLAVCRAVAREKKIPLYRYIAEKFGFSSEKFKTVPMFNVLNGGEHSDSGLSVQEFKIVPNGIREYCEQLRAGSEIFYALRSLLQKDGFKISVGDEGGFAPNLESNSKALEFIVAAVVKAGYKLGEQINLGLDVAANSFYDKSNDHYLLKPENVDLEKDGLINLYKEWRDKFFVISVEDGLMEDDWDGWKKMNEKIGDTIMLIGDDHLVTNSKRLKKALVEKTCNSVLVKVNQIGTLSETIEFVKLAQENNLKTVVSHRSGETTDDFIADLAAGIGADFIKTGSLSRGERISKYNRLLQIAQEMN